MTQSGHFNDIKCASAPLMPSIYRSRRMSLPGGERQLEGNVRHRGILPGLVNALERSGAGCASIRAGSRQDLVFTGITVALPPTRVAHGEGITVLEGVGAVTLEVSTRLGVVARFNVLLIGDTAILEHRDARRLLATKV